MIERKVSKFYQFYPCNVTLIGAKRGDKVNFMAAAWNTGLSFDPPLFGVAVAPKRFTYDMVIESGEFTCNFLSREHIELVHGTGRVSGRDCDKVQAFGIPLEEPEVIGCPTIETAYAAYECRLVHSYPVGDHDFFVGEVVAVHYDGNVFTGEGLLDPAKVDFTMYLGSNMYISADADSVRLMPAEVDVG